MLASNSRGVFLTRRRLQTALRDTLGMFVTESQLNLQVRGDQSGERSDVLEIDARNFSQLPYPAADTWQKDLLAPLAATAAWAKQQEIARIRLSGQYRLSTALALGWSFRAATGFELDIPTRAGLWLTDDRPSPDLVIPFHSSDATRLQDGRLALAIGVLRDPVSSLVAQGRDRETILALQFDQAIPDSKAAQQVARQIKEAVIQTVDRLRPRAIDLFFAGPAALAVALGHRWNAMPPTQLHEFDQDAGVYTPSACLAAF